MINIAIQAGGKSSRMGEEKALLDFHGEPLISRIINRVSHLSNQIFIITNNPQPYRFLNRPLYGDRIPDIGALGGLHTALFHSQQPILVMVACDMPFVSSKILAQQVRMLENNPRLGAVIPKSKNGHLEPMHAVYRPEICIGPVKDAIDQGKRRLRSWLYAVPVEILDWKIALSLDPTGRAFFNLNTPADYRQALDYLPPHEPG